MVNQKDVFAQLTTIFAAGAPPFVFIHEPSSCTGRSRDIVSSALASLSSPETKDASPDALQQEYNVAYAFTNCAAAFTSRLLFDSVLSALGAEPLVGESTKRALAAQKMDSLDAFLHALSDVLAGRTGEDERKVDALVLVFERAERLRDVLPGLVYPLARLHELVRTGPVMTVFISEVDWEHITPVPGTLADPYRIVIDPPNRSDTVAYICGTFPTDISSSSLSAYNPALRPLFAHFVETVYDVCAPFLPENDPRELAYIAAARWPRFVAPVLVGWKAQAEAWEQSNTSEELEGDISQPFAPPTEEIRIRMLRGAASSLAGAVERLYPRLAGADEVWGANAHAVANVKPVLNPEEDDEHALALSLPRAAAFVLLAAYLASHNPARTDARMFGRSFGREGGRGRKKGGGTRKTRGRGTTKLPQRLLGPTTFTYDRLIAVLGALLCEYDDDNYAVGAGVIGGDSSARRAEADVYRVQTAASIQELVALRLLHRAAAADKLDAPGFRCALSHAPALRLARRLGVPLGDLLWEPS